VVFAWLCVEGLACGIGDAKKFVEVMRSLHSKRLVRAFGCPRQTVRECGCLFLVGNLPRLILGPSLSSEHQRVLSRSVYLESIYQHRTSRAHSSNDYSNRNR